MTFPRALRSLVARPLFSAVAIATLALGLGVNAAIFSLTREVLLRPLPYRDADRLVGIFEHSPAAGIDLGPVAPVHYINWRARVSAFEQTAVFRRVAFNVSGQADAEQVEGFRVDSGFFPMLGTAPAAGRGITDDDAKPGRDDVVLLTDGFRRRWFGADPDVVGQTIDVDGTPCTVVGVLPASFTIFHVLNRSVELFRPLVIDPTDREHSINVYGKLRPSVSVDRARAELAAVYASLPPSTPVWTADVRPLSAMFAAGSRATLAVLEGAAAFVLLIACANIANLLLAHSAGRRKELAVRHALGATRWRIARDLSGETLILTLAAGAVALLLAVKIVPLLEAIVSFQDVNRLHPFQVDRWVLAFTSALTVGVAVVFGVLPARAAARIDVVDALKDMTHGVTTGVSHRRLRQVLVVGELALSIVLAASALALTRSAVALQRLERGLDAGGVMTAQVSLSDPRYADTRQLLGATSAILDRLATSPPIASTALVNYPPLSTIRLAVPVSVDGRPPPTDLPFGARYWVVSPNYFNTVAIPVLAGRDFSASDAAQGPGVAIVSETFARRFWNTTDVVGRRLETLFPPPGLFWIPRARRGPLTIVGVVGDVREAGLRDVEGLPQLYLPYAQNPTVVVTVLARARAGRAEVAAPSIREAVRLADRHLPVSYAMSLDAVRDDALPRPREMAWLVGAFAALALVLSAIGVYGVMSYLTTARTQEIGIRIALGAAKSDIVLIVVGHTLKLTAAGAVIGVLAAPMAIRLVSGLLFGVGPFDPASLIVVVLLLCAVSIVASTIPAVRAARIASVSFR